MVAAEKFARVDAVDLGPNDGLEVDLEDPALFKEHLRREVRACMLNEQDRDHRGGSRNNSVFW